MKLQHYSMPSRPSVWSSIIKGVTGAVAVGVHYLLDTLAGNPNPQERGVTSHLARTAGKVENYQKLLIYLRLDICAYGIKKEETCI